MARTSPAIIDRAVVRSNAEPAAKMLDKAFAFAFRGLVYAQIWEDPVVDMAGLALNEDSRIVAIASGGCNALSYLTGNPRSITAVDLNTAHIALNKLKIAAVQHLPDYEHLRRLFGDADHVSNLDSYRRLLVPYLDEATRRYWEGRDLIGRRRIKGFTSGFYKRGMLGGFIGLAHMVARLYRVDLSSILAAETLEEQRLVFDEKFAPIFERRFIRWLTDQPASLFGLGIPPAQYEALAGNERMATVLRGRLEKLACHFPVNDNYFAWQAFSRGYGRSADRPLPPYLQEENFAAIRERAGRIEVCHVNLTEHLARQPDASLDRYVLLDAQDWMDDLQLTRLWQEITRTARPGSRVLFRTAAEPTLLPGRIPDSVLSRWDYAEAQSAELDSRGSLVDLRRGTPLSAEVTGMATIAPEHGQLMDSIYRGQRHIYDATRKYYLFGRDRLIAGLDLHGGGSVLEIGCGTGRNLALIARRWPGAQLFGLDISAEMLKSAAGKLGAQAVLARGDATGFDAAALFGRERFDRVVLSFATSMIPNWVVAVDRATELVAPGGALLLVDFADMDGLPAPLRGLLRAWLTRFHVTPRSDLALRAAAIAARHGLAIQCHRGFGGYYQLIELRAPKA